MALRRALELQPASQAPLTFRAKAAHGAAIENYGGDQRLGRGNGAEHALADIKLSRGLHALFAVATTPDGKRAASRPGFPVVH